MYDVKWQKSKVGDHKNYLFTHITFDI